MNVLMLALSIGWRASRKLMSRSLPVWILRPTLAELHSYPADGRWPLRKISRACQQAQYTLWDNSAERMISLGGYLSVELYYSR